MLLACAPLLILGGLICFLPSTTIGARSEFPYPDGSICFQCTSGDAGSQACAPEIFAPGACDGRACGGADRYYQGGYDNQELKRGFTRVTYGKSNCLFRAQVYSYGSEELYSTEECCFKPGSPVCFIPLIVHYSFSFSSVC